MTAEMPQISTFINFIGRYIQAISNIDLDLAQKLAFITIKKYQKFVGQVEIKLNWLHDQFLVITSFMKHLSRVYNKKKITKNRNTR